MGFGREYVPGGGGGFSAPQAIHDLQRTLERMQTVQSERPHDTYRVVVAGDSSTRANRTAAVTAAVNTAKTLGESTVYVPDAFLDFDPSSITFSGVELTTEGPPFFNVKAYGAAGDGSQDDTNALSTALSEADSAGGGFVYIPAGHYIISSALDVANEIVVLGAGRGATAPTASTPRATTLIDAGGGTALNIGGSRNYVEGITLSDFQVYGTLQIGAQSATSDHGVRDCMFERLIVKEATARGFYLKGQAYRNAARDIKVRNCGGAGVWVEHTQGSLFDSIHCFGNGATTDGMEMRFSDAGGGGGGGLLSMLDCDVQNAGVDGMVFDGLSQATILCPNSEGSGSSETDGNGITFQGMTQKCDPCTLIGGQSFNHGGDGLHIGDSADTHKTYGLYVTGVNFRNNTGSDIALGSQAERCHIGMVTGSTAGAFTFGNVSISNSGFQTTCDFEGRFPPESGSGSKNLIGTSGTFYHQIAFHDGTTGTHTNPAGPCWWNGTNWIDLIDGNTVI